MNYEIGSQYAGDEEHDQTGFKKKARLHQSRYRAEVLEVDWEKYGNYLTEVDANNGLNFYDGFQIFTDVKERYPNKEGLYTNMLRSEHIPFNFFVPLKSDLNLAKDILNEFFEDIIDDIKVIIIEYAPSPRKEYLNDGTSFDVYIEFTHVSGGEGVLGIEVKYTEKDYPLKGGSKEESFLTDKNSPYNEVTRRANLYKTEFLNKLPEDRYRQIWRNQLLAESMTKMLNKDSRFEHASTAILYPKGNEHFMKVTTEYSRFLTVDGKNKFKAITYEDFIEVARKLTTDDRYIKWINYLSKRYIVE